MLAVAIIGASQIPIAAAHAVPPTRDTEPPFDFASSTVFCGFPLRAETLQNNIKITTFSDGHQLVTGGRTVRLTNLATGRTLTLRDTGNVTTNAAQTSETLTGSLVLFLFPGEPFGPGAWLFDGHTTATFAQPGGFTYGALALNGKQTDLCAALSA
jgi:hypothetical protein